MSIERRLKKLEDNIPKAGFRLRDGSFYTYDPERYGIEMFLTTMASTVADGEGKPRPPVPELLKALCSAKDRRRAMHQMYPDWRTNPPMAGYCLRTIVETGELVLKPLVKGLPAQEPRKDGTVEKDLDVTQRGWLRGGAEAI